MASGSSVSTREKLLSLIDDIELISKELLENTASPKGQKLTANEHSLLTDLLIKKDKELKETMKVAAEQAEIQQKMEALQSEVDKQDQDIQRLQKKLKEAEQLLATAIYQAKQKLQSIAKANKHPISSEELIKYAHRISASNAVCAPLTWQQGDPRRPYPTDIEMRMGLLGRLSDLPINGHLSSLADSLHRAGHPPEPPSSQHSTFTWHSGEIHMAMGNQGSVAMDTRSHKESEDVEVMSTDSSSSSSSDSQ